MNHYVFSCDCQRCFTESEKVPISKSPKGWGALKLVEYDNNRVELLFDLCPKCLEAAKKIVGLENFNNRLKDFLKQPR